MTGMMKTTRVQNDSESTAWIVDLKEHGLEPGTRVSASIEIETSPDKVWQLIAEPGNLKRCHPFCASTEVEKWPGPGARDSITYYSGRQYVRNFVDWFEGTGYDIELGSPPAQTARVIWRITLVKQNRSKLSIDVIPYLKANLPISKKLKYQERLFGSELEHYLQCVVKGVDYVVTTGVNVKKNQFGTNPLYSD